VAAGLVPALTNGAPVGASVGDPVFPDFNNDGAADVVIGIDQEDIGGLVDAGAVEVHYGNPFDGTADKDQFWSNASTRLFRNAEANNRFGDATAAGDFDGDGFDDLAIGEWGATVNTFKGAGQVHIIYGGVNGLAVTYGYQHVDQETVGVESNAQPDDQFGRALAAGDVNNDGMDDLVVGAPRENVGGANNSGATQVFAGSPGGLVFTTDLFFRQGSTGAGILLGDAAENEDIFGSAVGTGDFNNDGNADVVIGVQGETLNDLDVDPNNDVSRSGAFHVLYGNGTFANLGTVRALFDEDDLPGGALAGSRLGCTFASGNYNGDAFTDLAVCADGRRVGTTANAGAVFVLRGAGGGLTASGAQRWDFDTAGVRGTPTQGDNWGDSLASGDFNNDGRDDLAIAVDKKDLDNTAGVDHGLVLVFPGGNNLLTVNSGKYKGFSEKTRGIPSFGAQSGDEFGSHLQSADYNSDGRTDLYIAAGGKSVSGKAKAGALYLLKGATLGVTSSGSKVFTQNSPGILDTAEAGDFYGGT
jgi:hypothetical protein